MTENTKVVSLKFVGADGSPVDYVMIEGEDVEQAKRRAGQWAEQNVSQSFDRIEEHQGVMIAPDSADDGTVDQARVWHLPF